MILNILQCIAQSPTTKAYLVQTVHSAEVEKPWIKPMKRAAVEGRVAESSQWEGFRH